MSVTGEKGDPPLLHSLVGPQSTCHLKQKYGDIQPGENLPCYTARRTPTAVRTRRTTEAHGNLKLLFK